MSRALSVLVILLVILLGVEGQSARKKRVPLEARPRPSASAPGAALAGPSEASAPATPAPVSRCGLCHRSSDWLDVRFDHDPTGFPLKGSHRRVMCKACHPMSFKAQVPESCAGCHRDPHAATFGQLCDGCHDEERWTTNFTVDAHRQTNFPLAGRHAMIPCRECHPQARDRVFARTPITCATCHLSDYQRAAATSVDHEAARFPMDCRQCHSTFQFRPARFPEHDRCFSLSGGPHSGIRCNHCHVGTTPAAATGSCSTNSATCTACHEHSCERSDRRHTGVGGYECKDRKCYECHRFAP